MNDFEIAEMLYDKKEYYASAFYYESWLNDLYCKISASIDKFSSILNNSIAIEKIDNTELLNLVSIKNTSFVTTHYMSYKKPVEVCEDFVFETCDRIREIYKKVSESKYAYLLEQ